MARSDTIPWPTALLVGGAATLAISSMAIGLIEFKRSGVKRNNFRPFDYLLFTASVAYSIYQGGDLAKQLDTWSP